MRFSITITYPATPPQVAKLLHLPQFYRARWSVLDPNAQASVNATPTEITIASDFHVSPPTSSKLPPIFNSRLPVKVMEVINKDASGELTRGTFTVKAQSSPVKANGTTSFTTDAAGNTTMTVNGQVNCSVPIFGATIEKAIVDQIRSSWGREAEVAGRFLDTNE